MQVTYCVVRTPHYEVMVDLLKTSGTLRIISTDGKEERLLDASGFVNEASARQYLSRMIKGLAHVELKSSSDFEGNVQHILSRLTWIKKTRAPLDN